MTTLLTKSILRLEVNTVSKHNPIIPESQVIVVKIHVCCKNNNEVVTCKRAKGRTNVLKAKSSLRMSGEPPSGTLLHPHAEVVIIYFWRRNQ